MAIDPSGGSELLIPERDAYHVPRASPDGRRVAVGVLRDGDYDIWLVDLERRTRSLFQAEGNTPAFAWSPDGTQLAYGGARDGTIGLFARPINGDSPERVVTTFEGNAGPYPISWTDDGELLFTLDVPGLTEDIYAISVGDGGDPYPLLASELHEQAAVTSPDGRWLAYVTDNGLTVKPFAGAGHGIVVSRPISAMPRWSLDGSELYFLAGDGLRRMMATSVDASPSDPDIPTFSEPRVVLEYTFGGGIGYGLHRYDVMQDGRFVFATPEAETSHTRVNVLLDGFEELTQLAPGGAR